MEKDNKLAALTLEELVIKQKRSKAAMTGLGIVMLTAIIIRVFLAVKSHDYTSMAIVFVLPILFLPGMNYLKQLNAEIKSRNPG